MQLWARMLLWPGRHVRAGGCLVLARILVAHTGEYPCSPMISTSWGSSGRLCVWSITTRPSPVELQLAPKLLTTMTGGLARAMACKGIPAFPNYLDTSSAHPLPHQRLVKVAGHLCWSSRLLSLYAGLPTAPGKVVGPPPPASILFLEVDIDSVCQGLWLP